MVAINWQIMHHGLLFVACEYALNNVRILSLFSHHALGNKIKVWIEQNVTLIDC